MSLGLSVVMVRRRIRRREGRSKKPAPRNSQMCSILPYVRRIMRRRRSNRRKESSPKVSNMLKVVMVQNIMKRRRRKMAKAASPTNSMGKTRHISKADSKPDMEGL
jgi:hypothetical protein